MEIVNVHEAKTHFSRLLDRAQEDQEFVIAKAVRLVARLGPLARQFPKCQSVRYYLGLMLGWTGQREAAIEQFQKTVALGPGTPLGKGAAQFLSDVKAGQNQGGTTPTTK